MEELSISETNMVSGGNPLVAVGLGNGGSYLYDSLGGKEGIDEHLEKGWESFKSSARYWSRQFQRSFDFRQQKP